VTWLDTGAVSLRVDLSGEGTATLVLLHELGGSLASFDGLMPTLARSLRVIRYDQRGAGLSEKPPGGFSLADHVADLDAVLAAHGLAGPVHLAGVAAGAAIAVAFALLHPSKVASLSLCAPAWA
jgi:3-oxoadipate enol-lactonase